MGTLNSTLSSLLSSINQEISAKEQQKIRDSIVSSIYSCAEEISRKAAHHKIDRRFELDQKIDNIITTFVPLSLKETELYMTVYAAWNNLIIRNEPTTIENIITEALDLWKNKREKFTEKDVKQAMEWLEEVKYVPNGFGKEIY